MLYAQLSHSAAVLGSASVPREAEEAARDSKAETRGGEHSLTFHGKKVQSVHPTSLAILHVQGSSCGRSDTNFSPEIPLMADCEWWGEI